MDDDIIITDIMTIRLETMHADAPYISTFPRDHSSMVYTLEGTGRYTSKSISYTHNQGEISIVPGGETDISEYLTETVRYIFFDFNTVKPLVCSSNGLPLVPSRASPRHTCFCLKKRFRSGTAVVFLSVPVPRAAVYVINRLIL